MTPTRRSSSRLPTAPLGPQHAPRRAAGPYKPCPTRPALSPVDSGYGSDSSSRHARATSDPPCSGTSISSADSAGSASPRARCAALSASPPPAPAVRNVTLAPILSLNDLVPDFKPGPPAIAALALAPPSATHPPSQLPPLSPLLALFPSPLQSRLTIASFFSNPPAWATAPAHAAEHGRFVAELDAPSASEAVDFGWLALLFAVVGIGACALEANGVDGGVLRRGMGELWVRGSVALLELAEWRTKPSHSVLRAVLALNGYWAGLEDSRILGQTVRLNDALEEMWEAQHGHTSMASSASHSEARELLAALASSTQTMRLMLGVTVSLAVPLPAPTAPASPAELLGRLHVAHADGDSAGTRTHAGLLLDAWDAASPATALPAPAAVAFLAGALVLAREAVAHPHSPTSFGTRARLLARLARPPAPLAGHALLLERGLELLALVLSGEEGKWAGKCTGWVEAADARREADAEAERAREAAVEVKEEESWSRFLVV